MVEIKLKPGMKFKYKDIDFICLDVIDGNYLAITADCLCEKRFNDNYNDGCNNWKTSTLRRFLNKDVLEEHFDAKHLIKQTSDLTADNSFGLAPVCLFNSQALRAEYSGVRLVGVK